MIKQSKANYLVVIGTAAALLVSIFAVDDRYVHNDSFESFKKSTSASIVDLRVSGLQDNIFALTYKVNTGKATNLDKALLQRYRAQLNRLSRTNTTSQFGEIRSTQ